MYGPYGKFVIYSYILTCMVDKFVVYNNKYFVLDNAICVVYWYYDQYDTKKINKVKNDFLMEMKFQITEPFLPNLFILC